MHASPPFSAALAELLPAPHDEDADHLPAFRAAADLILNRTTLYIAGRPHRITEIEVYWHSPGHPDSFTHGDVMQQEFARWYFHRSGGEYRGGTYKGLDIAAGGPEHHAGILVRGLAELGDEQTLIDGPCMCVDHILARTKRPTIAALVAGFDRAVDAPAGGGSPLHLGVDGDRRADVHASARVGLTLKRGVLAERARYLARPYRFLSEPASIKKGRPHLIIGMHRDGRSADEIAELTGSSRSTVTRTIADYESGKSHQPAEFTGDPSGAALCRLLGACDALA